MKQTTANSKGIGGALTLLLVLQPGPLGYAGSELHPSLGSHEDQEVNQESRREADLEAKKLIDQARSYVDQQRYVDAIEVLNQALKRGKGPSELFVLRGRSYYELGRFEEALADANRAILIRQDDAYAHFLRASIYGEMGKPHEAIADLTKGIGIGPDPLVGFMYGARGTHYLALNEPDKALRDLSQAINLGASTSEAFFSRGKALTQLGRYEEAIRDFTKILAQDPAHTDSLLHRGWLYGCIGAFDKGSNEFNRVLSRDPDNLDALISRGWIHLEKGDLDSSIKDFTLAKDKGSQNPWLFINLARAYYMRGKLAEAIEANQKALDSKDRATNSSALFQKGIFLLFKGHDAVAQRSYEQATLLAQRLSSRILLEFAIEDLEETIATHPRLEESGTQIIHTLYDGLKTIPVESAKPVPVLCRKPKKEMRKGGVSR